MHGNILDAYINELAVPSNAFDLFKDEWSSYIPGLGLGGANLFEDHRIVWLEQRMGGFRRKNILELGPLEGAHTFMMSLRGAANITAIEANTRAFMKCLIVKNFLDFRADFMLGDFEKFIAERKRRYDFVLASGVLYHMTDPYQMLKDLSFAGDSLGIWTHFYDAGVIQSSGYANRFSTEPQVTEIDGLTITTYEQRYEEALANQAFTGGSAPVSRWMTLDSLTGALESFGYRVEMQEPNMGHVHGPCVLLYASRS